MTSQQFEHSFSWSRPSPIFMKREKVQPPPPRPPKTVHFLSQQNPAYAVQTTFLSEFNSILPSKLRSPQVLSSVQVSLSGVSTPRPQTLLSARRTAAATNPIHNTPHQISKSEHTTVHGLPHIEGNRKKKKKAGRSLHLATNCNYCYLF